MVVAWVDKVSYYDKIVSTLKYIDGRNRGTQMDVEKLMATKLTGITATQPCVITETGTNGNGVQFRGSMVIDYGSRTVGDVLRRCTSNVVIAAAPAIRKHIMDYRSKKTVSVKCPAPGSRERATSITTQSDALEFMADPNTPQSVVDQLIADVITRRTA
jgi:hypothetical protein